MRRGSALDHRIAFSRLVLNPDLITASANARQAAARQADGYNSIQRTNVSSAGYFLETHVTLAALAVSAQLAFWQVRCGAPRNCSIRLLRKLIPLHISMCDNGP